MVSILKKMLPSSSPSYSSLWFSVEVARMPAKPAIPGEGIGFEEFFSYKSIFLTKFFKKIKISEKVL